MLYILLCAFSAFSLLLYYLNMPIWSFFFGWLACIKLLNHFSQMMPFKQVIHWAHAMTFELLAFFGVILLRFLPQKSFVNGKEKRPILLVHGYFNHSNIWWFQKKWLKSFGLGPIYTINLGHPLQSICTYAKKVEIKAAEIAEETKRKDLTLIGHSMGGLVSAWYATKLAKKQLAIDVITIASPLLGTPMAHLGLGPNAKEMCPCSQFISELNCAIHKTSEVRFYHIATKSDQLVIPGTSALFLDNDHYIFDDLGHVSLLYSKKTARKIYEWISGN